MSSQTPQPKKKPSCLARLFTWVIVLAGLAVAANYLYPLAMQTYTDIRSQYALPEPDWAEYDAHTKAPFFGLVRINDGLVHGEYTGEDENFFFKNRLSVFGWDSAYEECRLTEYKCGEGNWAKFDDMSTRLLDNRCMVRVGPKDFCTVILPDGSLINATNFNTSMSIPDLLWYEEGLVFQVVMDETSITIKQGLTRQESMLWHVVRPNSPYSYRVEVGDKVVTDIGTTFGTHSVMKNGNVVAAVSKGSVQVTSLDPAVSALNVSSGTYAVQPAYESAQCPAALKPCGTSCIPMNGVCCNNLTGSGYCLAPLKCGDNFDGKCTSNMFFGGQTTSCCVSSSAFADDLSLMQRGSYDCAEGQKHCGMGCIAEERECCYPTDDDCPVEAQAVDVKDIPKDVYIPRAYLNSAYAALLGSWSFQEMMANPDFMSDYGALVDVRKFIQQELADKLAADEKASDPKKEAAQYCGKYPNNCVTKSSGSSGGSSSSSCPSRVPSDLRCSCGKRDYRGWVICESSQSGSEGQWYIPLNCLQKIGICK